MNIYEMRRLDLIDLRESIGVGAYRKMSDRTGIDASYLSRCAYEKGKAGRKNISDKIVEELDKAYPGWRKRELTQIERRTGSAKLSLLHEVKEPSDSNAYNTEATSIPYYQSCSPAAKKLIARIIAAEANHTSSPQLISALTQMMDAVIPETSNNDYKKLMDEFNEPDS